MRSNEIVARLHIGCRKHCADLIQRHVEITKAFDDLGDRNLLRRVAAIAGLRVDLSGLEKPRLMIVAQCLHRQMRRARESADWARGGHAGPSLHSPPTGESSLKDAIDSPPTGAGKVI